MPNNTTPESLADLMDLSASDYAAGKDAGTVCTPHSCLCCYGGCY